jgi:hypothetical protein
MVNRSPGFPDFTKGNYPAEGRSFASFLSGLWTTACHALGVADGQTTRTTQLLWSLLPTWSDERIGAVPNRQSYVAEDGFPAEMSVNWTGGRPELRMLFDSVGDQRPFPEKPASPGATRRRELIHDLFTPHAGRPSPAPVWHAVAWRPPAQMVHKTYYGLYEWPVPQRLTAVGAAMARLGLAAAWNDAHRRVEASGGEPEVEFLAVDLLDAHNARVKVYYRHHDTDLAELGRLAAVALNHDAGAAATAFRTLAGERADAGHAALTCLAFRARIGSAAESTTYLRLPTLTASDQEAVDRTSALLGNEGVDPGRFRALAAALAPGPLTDSTGLLELVSYRAAGRRGDITTYFRFPVYASQTLRPLTPADVT